MIVLFKRIENPHQTRAQWGKEGVEGDGTSLTISFNSFNGCTLTWILACLALISIERLIYHQCNQKSLFS